MTATSGARELSSHGDAGIGLDEAIEESTLAKLAAVGAGMAKE